MTIQPLPETILVNCVVPISPEALERSGSRAEATRLATRSLSNTAAAFGRVLVEGTVCLEAETNSPEPGVVLLKYSAFSVAAQ